MKFTVFQFRTPIDLRKVSYSSIDEMYTVFKGVPHETCETQERAIEACRRVFPDSVGMLCPVKVGSGTTMTVALIEKLKPTPLDQEIPFVLMVHARGDSDLDQRAIKKNRQFDMMAWRPPVLVPDAPTIGAELRVTHQGSVLPTRVTASLGLVRGKLVVYFREGNDEVSMAFDDNMREVLWKLAHQTAY